MLKQKYKINRLLMAALALSMLFSLSSGGKAFSAKSAATQDAIVSYNGESSIVPGMIVGLKPRSTTTIEPLSFQNLDKMLGVVIVPSQAAIVLTPASANQKQFDVASGGDYNVLVSNQDGYIKTGDSISISSISGIGMEASSGESEIIGKALSNFNAKSPTIGSAKLLTNLSSSKVSIGLIPVNIDIAKNPLLGGSFNYVPGAVSKAADAISDKPTSAAKIYLSLFILIVAFFLSGMLLYGGVRSGIQAVGRNPLSKKSIIKGLAQTVITGLAVFAAGISGVYLILKL